MRFEMYDLVICDELGYVGFQNLMCNQTFCTFAAPNCGILFNYYLQWLFLCVKKQGDNEKV